MLDSAAFSAISAPEWKPEATIIDLYWKAYSRPSQANELQHWLLAFEHSDSKQNVLSDLIWAILNSREFIFNH